MQGDLRVSAHDTRIGWRVVGILAVTAVIALVAWLATGWPGRAMFWEACTPQSVGRAKSILTLGVAAAGFYIGLQRLRDVPVTLRVFGACLAFAAFFTCTNFTAPHRGDTDFVQAFQFVLLPVLGFVLGVITRSLRGNS